MPPNTPPRSRMQQLLAPAANAWRAVRGNVLSDIALGMTPLGIAADVEDAAQAVSDRDPLGFALASLGAIPVVGDVAKRAAKGARKVAEESAKAKPRRSTRQMLTAESDEVGEEIPIMPLRGPEIRVPVTRWQPTSRSIFDRDVPDMQGTLPGDPRLAIAQYGTSRQRPSPLVEALVQSDTPRRLLDEDASRGMGMGGPEWYNLAPIRAFIESRQNMPTFRDWNTISAAASQSNSVPGEISAQSIIAFARANGLSLEEAKDIARRTFASQTGQTKGKLPLIYGSHMDIGEEGLRRGNVILPSNPQESSWKIPGYEHGRAGGGGLDINAPGTFPALDRHERYRLMQAVNEDPMLSRLAQELNVKTDDMLPLRNVKDYQLVSGLYTEGAKRFGLPTANAYQAARWTGGFDATGLKSPPYGDFTQALEDMILFNAQRRGLKTDPKSLRQFTENVFRGQDMLMPWTKSGPIPIR